MSSVPTSFAAADMPGAGSDAIRHGAPSPVLLVAMAVAVALVWFLTLDARHLLPSDEGRYAEIAREMLASGDWVTVRYNGLKYFEKPPLQFWMTALAFKAFGIGEWQARLWTALSGAAGLAASAWAARRWYGARVGVLTGLVLLATPAWNIGSHFASLDMALSGALAVVVAALLIAQHPEASARSRRTWMIAAWAAMGIGVLTKGPVAIVLPGASLIVYSAIERDLAIWRRLHLGVGLIVLLAIVEPWFMLVSQHNPEFLRFFFIHEHLQRYLSTVHHREGAWWYFVPQLLVGFLPWLGLSWSMVQTVRAERAGKTLRPICLLAVWAATVFIFFSLSDSKLPGYILPLYPALAILAARTLDRLDPRQWQRQLLAALALMLIGALATPWIARLGTPQTPNALYRSFAVWVGAGVAAGAVGLMMGWALRRRHPGGSIAAYALGFFALTTIVLRGHEAFGRNSSGVDLAARVAPLLDATTPLYGVRLLDHTLPFYLRHSATMVESPGELEFGVGREPQKWIPTLAGFVQVWTSGPHAFAVMSHPTYDELRAQHVPMRIVGEDVRRVVVANFEISGL
ncbi:MAG: glycosyltransferase family 39 protein [Pseudomonadota bacterium]|nr:glycosyltransferase family 39 protein [Pseudomonadota bacterium]